MQNKLKILMATEASFLSTGFANYTRELLSRLHATNKYEIAEFACYGQVNDPKDSAIPWKYYPNAVKPGDSRYEEYMSSPENQFGRWRFDKVVLDFKPDVVIDIRDYWMSHFEQTSSFRNFFHWILMPTVDSAPQQQAWLDTYEAADSVFTYSDFGANTIKQQTNNNINYVNTASPGINLKTFFPYNQDDRLRIRRELGIPEDAIIVGSVMRNQKRKLIPELVKAFRKTLEYYSKEKPDISNRMYLYLHTSFPDAGWDIPEILKDEQMLNKTLITYACKACNTITPSNFCGPKGICPRCNNDARHIPSVANGITEESLCKIYNIMDIYVQYAICEGFGMPQVEAGACGIPIATVNYSAMEDIVNKLDAYPIKIGSYFKELETKAIRVYPDNNSLKDILVNYISLPEKDKEEKRQKTRKLTEQHYDWDNIAKTWENHLDTIPSKQEEWKKPANFLEPINPDAVKKQQNNLTHLFAQICAINLKDIHYVASKKILSILQNLDYGYIQQGTNVKSYSIDDAIQDLNIYINNINNAEKARTSGYVSNEDYIKYAKIKAST